VTVTVTLFHHVYLNCWVLGDESSQIFCVNIKETASLKKAILDEIIDLQHTDIRTLQL
jgi:hypothetical protein